MPGSTKYSMDPNLWDENDYSGSTSSSKPSTSSNPTTSTTSKPSTADTTVKPIDPDKPKPITAPEPKPEIKPEPKPGDTPVPQHKPHADPTPAPGPEDGLNWFNVNWKTIAIVAGAAAIIAALAKLVKSLNNSIKIRFQKCANVLQRMQKDFTLSKDGLDMKAVLPGVGSKLMDKFARIWTGMFKGKKNRAKTGAIGLYPFCQAYKDEIAADFQLAQESFNKIAAAKEDSITSPKVESSTPVYNSFKSAYLSDHLNESETLNEFAIGTAIALSGLAIRGGQFIISQMKDGKPVKGSEKAVQVTKESTREICYAIMNNFLGKYINMDALMKKIGISAADLSDIDMSSADKMKKVLSAYGSVTDKNITAQYKRIRDAYNNMLKHYFNIGNGLITNFKNNTKAEDEKHQNLLIAAEEKLSAMWDKQKDIYNNNFSHVLLEIVKSEEYINYLNFILEKVFPVFKSGLAGDADYVLDVMPKKGEYYVVRQTQQQSQLKDGEQNLGNLALAKITEFNREAKQISFELVGLIKSDVDYNEDGTATITDISAIDKDAYKDDKPVEGLDFGKWLAIDPHLTDYKSEETKEDEPGKDTEDKGYKHTLVYTRRLSDADSQTNTPAVTEYIIGIENKKTESSDVIKPVNGNTINEDDASTNEEIKYNAVLYVQASGDFEQSLNISENITFVLSNDTFTDDEFRTFVTFKQNNNPASMGFDPTSNEETSDKIANIILQKNGANDKQIIKLSEIPPIINNIGKNAKTADKLFADIDKIATDIYNAWKQMNVGFDSFENVNNQNFAYKVQSPVNIKEVEHSVPVDTNVTNSAGDKVIVYILPKIYYKDKMLLPSMLNGLNDQQKQQIKKDCAYSAELCLGTDKSFIRGNKQTVWVCPDMKNIDQIKVTIGNLFKYYKNAKSGNKVLIADSINVDYETGVSESFDNRVTIKRTIKDNIDKSCYILSESVWDDGTYIDITKHLENNVRNVMKFRTYESLTSYAKRNKVTLTSSSVKSYTVSGPKNSTGKLSIGNPLYESIVIFKVNDIDNIVDAKYVGIHKIVK